MVEMNSDNIHLVLLIHGLWGKPAHLAAARAELEAAWADAESDKTSVDRGSRSPASSSSTSPEFTPPVEREKLVVVVAEGMTSALTYDGIDVCASRVAWEVDQHVARLEADGKRVTKFSVTGYSLGGLVARYLVGLLGARRPSFFDRHEPVSFSTIATPHLGIPRYNTLLSAALCFLGGRLIARSGEQLYVVDKYDDADPRPLLEVMADPKLVFNVALSRFKTIHIFANAINDNTVPYPSASIDTVDHFTQWAERSLIVETDEDGIINDWHAPKATTTKVAKSRFGWSMGTLPPMLRFRFPYNYFILILFPIMLPLIVFLMVARLSLDSRQSRRRLQSLSQASASVLSSTSSSSSLSSHIPSPHGLSIDSLRSAILAVERELEQDLILGADSGEKIDYTPGPPEQPEQMVQVRLSDSQLRMAHWLNGLDPIKHVVWYPEVANSHAVIIVRDPDQFPIHNRGRGVLKRWARAIVAA